MTQVLRQTIWAELKKGESVWFQGVMEDEIEHKVEEMTKIDEHISSARNLNALVDNPLADPSTSLEKRLPSTKEHANPLIGSLSGAHGVIDRFSIGAVDKAAASMTSSTRGKEVGIEITTNTSDFDENEVSTRSRMSTIASETSEAGRDEYYDEDMPLPPEVMQRFSVYRKKMAGKVIMSHFSNFLRYK